MMGAAASVSVMEGVKVMSPLGVKLSYLTEFIGTDCSEVDMSTITTAQVCEQIIKPMTEHAHTSMCELGNIEKHPKVGVAEVFISHWWGSRFIDTIGAVLHHPSYIFPYSLLVLSDS